MNGPAARARDFRLYTTLGGVLLLAVALAVLVLRGGGSKSPGASNRFLGLDQPVEPMPAR
jgi:hypothetical protein